jgi:hypothetical protein
MRERHDNIFDTNWIFRVEKLCEEGRFRSL